MNGWSHAVMHVTLGYIAKHVGQVLKPSIC